MPATAAAAVALASVLDAAFAEPPTRIHPVGLFGRIVARADRGGDDSGRRGWRRPCLVGVFATVFLPLVAAGAATGVVAASTFLHPWVGAAVAGVVLFSTASLRLLLDRVQRVIDGSDTRLDAAQTDLRALAGRDAGSLDAAHARSAAVESLAENLADGLVAPLAGFVVAVVAAGAVGGVTVAGIDAGLALAVSAAAWVKAVDTLDSMLGDRSKPVGWAPARLDDAVMWLPARASAAALAVAAGSPGLPLQRYVRVLARRPASPNAGWPMATVAAVLPARLRKPGAYDRDPGTVGSGGRSRSEREEAEPRRASTPLPDLQTATHAVAVTRRAGLLAAAAAGVIAWF